MIMPDFIKLCQLDFDLWQIEMSCPSPPKHIVTVE